MRRDVPRGTDVRGDVAAFEELDARYLAGEAAAHAHTWSIVTEGYAALNRGELPKTTTDFEDIDRRSVATMEPGDLMAYLRTALSDSARNSLRILAVHRLTDAGAVVTHVAQGTSREGFDAEWRITSVYIVEGNLINRCEMFDEMDLDTALARFEELHPQARRLENAASQVYERFQARFAARNWSAIAEMLVADLYSDDRRSVVGGGNRHGRDALIEDLRAVADVEMSPTSR